MLKIYLDKNIFSYFKDPLNQKALLLYNRIKQLEPFLTVIYSNAHLADLANRYEETDEYKKNKILEDLKLISEITQNQCLFTVLNHEVPFAGIKAPDVWFQAFIEKEESLANSLKSMKNAFIDDKTEKALEYTNKLNNLLNGPPIIDISEHVKDYPILEMFFGNKRTFGEQLEHFASFLDNINKNTELYKETNVYLKNYLNLSQDISNLKEDVFDTLNDMVHKKHGFEIISSENYKKRWDGKSKSSWERFSSTFIALNILGYNSDKLNKGVTNYHHDILHSYMAAHCDVFVTEDKKTYLKAKAAYEKERISTKVYTIQEAIAELEKYPFKLQTSQDILSEIYKSAVIKEYYNHYCDLESKAEIIYGMPVVPFLNYFNTIFINKSNNINNCIIFSKESFNFSDFNYISEVAKIVDILVNALGEDINKKGGFKPEVEDVELINQKWEGRQWRFDNHYFYIVPPQATDMKIKLMLIPNIL